jgi:hypothetical protein
LVVLVTALTTMGPTSEVFGKAAGSAAVKVDVRLIPGAWETLKTGDLSRYLAMIAEAADAVFAEGARVVAFAQSSMAPAVALCRAGAPMSSPVAGLAAAMAHCAQPPAAAV